MKDKIIFHVYEFLETGNIDNSDLAKKYLKEMAKKYHIKVKEKRIIYDVKDAFREFILNDKGYINTIITLYNSL